MRKVYHQIIRISGNVITVEADGVAYNELAEVTSARGTSLAQVIRLDGRKRWNMNRIEYKNELLCIDSPQAHYGMTCRPVDFKYAVGSGHEETGFGEKVVSVRFFVDGKEVFPQENIPLCGKKIKVEKVSKILDINVSYDILMENNIIFEFLSSTQIELS